MAYTDNFIDPGVVDDPFAAFENAPVQPPVDYGAAPVADEWSRPQSFGDFGEVARDTRLAAPPVDETAVQEYEPGESYTAPYVPEPEYQPPWQGVADALGGALETGGHFAQGALGVGAAVGNPEAQSRLNDLLAQAAQRTGRDINDPSLRIAVGRQLWEEQTRGLEITPDPSMGQGYVLRDLLQGANPIKGAAEMLADPTNLIDPGPAKELFTGFGLAAGALRNSSRLGRFINNGRDIVDGNGRIIATMPDEAAAARVVEQINRAPTQSSARTELDAAEAGMDQLRIPGVDDIAPGRVHGFDVPAQSMPTHARPERFEQQRLLDDAGTQPPLPEGAGPSGLPFSFSAADEAARTAREGSLDAATLNAKGIANLGDDVPRTADEGLFPGELFERKPEEMTGLPFSFNFADEVARSEIDDRIAQDTLQARGGIVGMAKGPQVTRLRERDYTAVPGATTLTGRPVTAEKGVTYVINEPGKPPIDLSITITGDKAHIEWIGSGPYDKGSKQFGPSTLRKIAEAVRSDYPQVKTVDGYRIGGSFAKDNPRWGKDAMADPFNAVGDDPRHRTWDLDTILRGRGPIIPGGWRNSLKQADELEAAAEAAVAKGDPEYAGELIKQADELRLGAGRFSNLIEESVGAPMDDAAKGMYAEIVDALVSGGRGAKQIVMDWKDPAKNTGALGVVVRGAAKLGEIIADVPRDMRAAMSTGDISLLFRQAGVPAVAHPKVWNEGADAAAQAMRSEAGFNKVDDLIRSYDSAALADNSGLVRSSLDNADQMNKVEYFQSPNVEKIPGAGRAVKASTRHATTLGNYIRATLFDNYAKAWGLMDASVDPKRAARDARDLASFLNSTTGVGNLGALESYAPALSRLFFAPKFFASRINNIFAPFVYGLQAAMPEGMDLTIKGKTLLEGGGSGRMAGLALKDMGLYYSFIITTAGLFYAAGNTNIGTDWRSSDFLKVKVGDHTIDMTGGYSNVFRFMAQQFAGEKKTNAGELVNLRDPEFGQQGALDVLGQFVRGLTAPGVGNVLDLAGGNKNLVGEPMGVTGHIPTPLGLSEFADAVITDLQKMPDKADALGRGIGMGVLGMLGHSVQTYDPKEKKPKVSQNPVDLWLAEHTGIGTPEKPRITRY